MLSGEYLACSVCLYVSAMHLIKRGSRHRVMPEDSKTMRVVSACHGGRVLSSNSLVASSEDFVALVHAVRAFCVIRLRHAVHVTILDCIQIRPLLLCKPQHLLLVIQVGLLFLTEVDIPA